MFILKSILKWLLIATVALIMFATAFLYLAPTFGNAPAGTSLARIEASANATNLRFENLVPTELDTREPGASLNLASYFFPPAGKNPAAALPSKKFNGKKLTEGQFIWLGHSSVLFKDAGLNILIDPVFNRASPVPFVGNPFPMENKPEIGDLPSIDVVLISHDHYDHLDHKSIRSLANTTTQFLVPLGIAAHLQRWGVSSDQITEFDWYESKEINNTSFVLTPARHFSGRGISNRFTTLWGSWVVKSSTLSAYFSGDTGYFAELKKIGQSYGPFDIAFLENGAYNKDWTQIHMMPEESAQAARDLQAKVFFPIHWSKFDLSTHSWTEPVIRAKAAAEKLDIPIATPLIGEVFDLSNIPQSRWWE